MIGKKTRKYKAFLNKYSWFFDLLEDHPFELGLSLALILFGSRAFLSGLQSVPGSVQLLPFALAIIYCLLSVIGGVGVVFGLVARRYVSWAYGAERFGLFVSAAAWASYIVGYTLTSEITGRSTLLIGALSVLFVGCLLRARAIGRRENATISALRQASFNGHTEVL